MSETKWTKGKWTLNPLDLDYEDGSIFAPTLANGKRQLIATVPVGGKANARLIAAAPTMAETLLTAKNAIEIAMGELEACLRELNASIRDNEGMTTGREAIAAIDSALAPETDNGK
jgi:S-adenosylmethionine:diacylglycerol 3-amino-3-carboxypropyl transferase